MNTEQHGGAHYLVKQRFWDLGAVDPGSFPDLLSEVILPALGHEPPSRLWENPVSHRMHGLKRNKMKMFVWSSPNDLWNYMKKSIGICFLSATRTSTTTTCWILWNPNDWNQSWRWVRTLICENDNIELTTICNQGSLSLKAAHVILEVEGNYAGLPMK